MKSARINDKKRVLWKKVKSSQRGRGKIVKNAANHGREQGGENQIINVLKDFAMKMKSIFVIIMALSITMVSYAQGDIKWDYPVKPGVEEWNNLKTEEERVATIQIPNDILERMTTEELAFSCVNFPLFGYYTAFNSPQDGFNIMFYRFNIFQFLCGNKEACNLLIDIYRDADINGWTKYNNILNSDYWTLKLSYIEYLIAQNDFLFNIGDNAKKELIQIAKRKIEDKINSNSFNSISGISPSYYLIAHILNDKGLLKRTDSSFLFLKTGMIIDFQLIKDIEDSCEQFLNLK